LIRVLTMGSSQSTEKKSPSVKGEDSIKKRTSDASKTESPELKGCPTKSKEQEPITASIVSTDGSAVTEKLTPKPDEIIPVVEDDTAIAAIEAATKDKEATEGGIKYDVVLSPAVKKQAPRITPPISPLTEDELNKKLNEATERRISLDNIRMKSLSEHMAKIELAQQKKEDIVAQKSSKVAETLSTRLTVAEENRTAQMRVVKDKLGEHMGKIEKAQRELEHQLEAARIAAEASLSEKMESHKKKRDEEMEEMLKKIQEHQEKVSKVRSNQEERLKPYVNDLENNIKEKLDRARIAKEKQEELLKEKIAEQNRKAELVRQNKERLQAEAENNQTTESA